MVFSSVLCNIGNLYTKHHVCYFRFLSRWKVYGIHGSTYKVIVACLVCLQLVLYFSAVVYKCVSSYTSHSNQIALIMKVNDATIAMIIHL